MALVFSFSQIALTAAIMAVVSLLLLLGARQYFKRGSLGEVILIALVAGFSVLVWRSVGNTTALNADPIPAISPNDVLCPVITYVFLGMYAAVRKHGEHDARFEQIRAVLTLVSFVVNVITI
ncbi:MAG TPA: hypothetical protein VKX46_23235 [Ktedonobacteraceae bacterium]|nr:hypothetical protein [Ktedonobacteraceae bacterium]